VPSKVWVLRFIIWQFATKSSLTVFMMVFTNTVECRVMTAPNLPSVKMFSLFLATWVTLSCPVHASAQALTLAPEKITPARGGGSVTIDNGIPGLDGSWDVNVLQGGDSDAANLGVSNTVGRLDLVYSYATYIDVGANGGAYKLDEPDANAGNPVLGANNTVISSGQFLGTNGTIFWTSSARIPPGAQTYQVTINFSSPQTFGTVRVINYLDEDVLGSSDDRLILINETSSPVFQLLTIDNVAGIGIAHTVGFQSTVNASYIGWAGSKFPYLREEIIGAIGAQYSISGVVNPLEFPASVDPRFTFSRAYGPADATAAFAFDLNPNASSATLVFGLGGQPNVQNDAIFRDGFQ
jgi:hypothetical protein